MADISISPLSYLQVKNPHVSSSASQTASPSAASTPSAAASPAGGLAPNESTFLTLLVSQLKNQDPLNPTDSTQFVSELAQFSSLEQLININQNVGTMTNTVSGAATASTASTALTGASGTTATVPGSVTTTGYNSLLNSIG